MDVRNLQHVKRDGGETISHFSTSLDTLKHFMELRRGEAISKLQELGGIDHLCQTLHTSPKYGMM